MRGDPAKFSVNNGGRIAYVCAGCDKEVEDHRGALLVGHLDVANAEEDSRVFSAAVAALADWRQASIETLGGTTGPARWQAWHHTCAPLDLLENSHHWDIERCRSAADLLARSVAQRSARWLDVTDWDDFVAGVSAQLEDFDIRAPLDPRGPCPHCKNTEDGVYGWHVRKGPDPVLRSRHGLRRYAPLPDWVDHPYRLRLSDGRWRYVAEPYGQVDGDAAADFVALEEAGFDVYVTAEAARHYPGQTTAVLITPRKL